MTFPVRSQSRNLPGNRTVLPTGAATGTDRTAGARPGCPGPCEGRVVALAQRAGAILKLMGKEGAGLDSGGTIRSPVCPGQRSSSVGGPRRSGGAALFCLLPPGTHLAQSHRPGGSRGWSGQHREWRRGVRVEALGDRQGADPLSVGQLGTRPEESRGGGRRGRPPPSITRSWSWGSWPLKTRLPPCPLPGAGPPEEGTCRLHGISQRPGEGPAL